MLRPAGVALLALSLVLAGCAGQPGGKSGEGSGSPAAGAGDPSFSGDAGSVTGTVTDDEGVPIGGARVGIPELQTDEAADATGAFTFNNIPPGTYAVHAEQLGYESKAQKVTVVAGEVVTVKFLLPSLAPSGVARQLNYIADGFVELAIVIPTYGVLYFNETGENLNLILYGVAGDAASAVMGLQWGTSAPMTGRYVRMNTLTCKPAASCTQANFTRGFSPLIIRTDDLNETIDGKKGYFVAGQFYPTSCTAISPEFCAANPDTIFEVTAQQRYKLYTSVFFVEPAPPGFDPLPG